MIGLDTNVLVRYLVQDDPGQSREDIRPHGPPFACIKRGRADFADCLLGATNQSRGCERTVTFDQSAGILQGFRPLDLL